MCQGFKNFREKLQIAFQRHDMSITYSSCSNSSSCDKGINKNIEFGTKFKILEERSSGKNVLVEAVRSATMPFVGDKPYPVNNFMRRSDFSLGPRHGEPSDFRVNWVSKVTRLKRTSSHAKSTWGTEGSAMILRSFGCLISSAGQLWQWG